MSKYISNEELVNNYFDNEMSEIERMNFESKLLTDSDLSKEYNFQNDLVNGIKETRRLELKNRLNNIPINTPLYQTIGIKTLAAICIATGIGIGAYYTYNSKNDANFSIDIELNKTPLSKKLSVPKPPKSIAQNLESDTKQETELEYVPIEKPNAKILLNDSEVESTVIKPNIVQPTIVDSFEDESLILKNHNIENSISILTEDNRNKDISIEVSKIKDKRKKFHYKFSKNKLYLIGNFNDNPYEIIELNSIKGKTYFLHYNDSFYRINSEQSKPTPLIKIENDSLIYELKIIQTKQINR